MVLKSVRLPPSAALAGFHNHVGELLNTRCAAYEVHDSEGLQVLRNAAGCGGGLGVQLVVEGQNHVVVVVGAPEVRTVAGTEVGFVTFWLVDPLPVEVTPEVDVERAQAAALVRATGAG